MLASHAELTWLEAEHPPISDSHYRETMRLVPGAVAILATRHDGVRYGITATAICSVSADPAQLMVCVNRVSSLVEPLAKARRLSVNFLSTAQTVVAGAFSSRTDDPEQRFRCGVWTATETGMPALQGSVATLDCVVLESADLATHQAILVRVVNAHTSPINPLLYFAGQYHDIGEPIRQEAA